MKALRPEIAKLKEKYGADQQAMSMEQMKLFREAGVNPLGGCIPALLQIPIFFALYSFFSSSVDLRGADFLWAKDLSAFDDVIKFGVHIPLLGKPSEFVYNNSCINEFSYFHIQYEYVSGSEQSGVEIHALYFPGISFIYF